MRNQRTINPPTSSLRSQFSELPRSTFWVPGRSNQRSKSTHHSIQAAQEGSVTVAGSLQAFPASVICQQQP